MIILNLDKECHLEQKIINGKFIASSIRRQIAYSVSEMRTKHGVTPGLAVLLIGDDPGSQIYVKNKVRACEEAGILSKVIEMPADTSLEESIEVICSLNTNPKYHGILLQLPVPKHLDENLLIETINEYKDEDGIHPLNMGLLMAGRPRFIPATPLAVKELLMRENCAIAGKHIVICGRSNIVGKPLSSLLMQKTEGANATVTVCHTGTEDLMKITRQADILISAMGQPGIISENMVKSGITIIDVGINRLSSTTRNGKTVLKGDVDFDSVLPKVSRITPVPGGVGPVTIAMLLRNTIDAARYYIHPELEDHVE